MKKKTSVGSKIILTLTMLFFYLPILYIIVFSFNDSPLAHQVSAASRCAGMKRCSQTRR